MKRILIATVITTSALAATAGFAQTADHDPAMPAVATSSSVNPDAPAAGKNSFTEKQVVERLHQKGFKKVAGLKLDTDGVWRGTASMKGVKQNVTLDYQGNITAE